MVTDEFLQTPPPRGVPQRGVNENFTTARLKKYFSNLRTLPQMNRTTPTGVFEFLELIPHDSPSNVYRGLVITADTVKTWLKDQSAIIIWF